MGPKRHLVIKIICIPIATGGNFDKYKLLAFYQILQKFSWFKYCASTVVLIMILS